MDVVIVTSPIGLWTAVQVQFEKVFIDGKTKGKHTYNWSGWSPKKSKLNNPNETGNPTGTDPRLTGDETKQHMTEQHNTTMTGQGLKTQASIFTQVLTSRTGATQVTRITNETGRQRDSR